MGSEGAEGQGRERGHAKHRLGAGAVKGKAAQGMGGVGWGWGAGGVWPALEVNQSVCMASMDTRKGFVGR